MYITTISVFSCTKTPPGLLVQRKKWSTYEKEKLLQCFQSKVYLGREELCQLANSLNTSHERVKNWFSYMRRIKIEEGMFIESECTMFSNLHILTVSGICIFY